MGARAFATRPQTDIWRKGDEESFAVPYGLPAVDGDAGWMRRSVVGKPNINAGSGGGGGEGCAGAWVRLGRLGGERYEESDFAGTGLDGSSIAWASSNPAVVSTAGVVTQPQTQDASVTLTATITVDSASDTKAFPVTVKAQMTDAQAVAAAKAALAIGYASGDSAASVTQNLTLTASGIDGTSVAWESSDPAVVSAAGSVSRPLTGGAEVSLTATISLGAASDTKVFDLVIKPQLTDAQAVAAAKAALVIGYASGDSASSVTQNLTLAASGIDGTSITWASNSSDVVSTAGAVTQPVTGDASVVLTATITLRAASDTKAFPITVKAQMTDAQAVAAAKAALAIGYQPGDAASSVTQNITLPVTGAAGCTISWASSDQAIAVDGTVSRPVTGDLPVTLDSDDHTECSQRHEGFHRNRQGSDDGRGSGRRSQGGVGDWLCGRRLRQRSDPERHPARYRQQRNCDQLGVERRICHIHCWCGGATGHRKRAGDADGDDYFA